MDFNVQIEKPSNILRKLTIRVPATTVRGRIEKGLQEVQRTAKLKGFRPGHVPISVVKQYYGEDVRHQVFHHLIDEAYRQALRDQKILAVGAPKIETPEHQTGAGAHDHSIHEDQDLTFTATVEVVPEIEVKNYKGIPITQPKVEVTEKDVDQVVNELRESQAELIPVSGGLALPDGSMSSRPVQKADYVEIKFDGGVVTESGVEEKAGMKGTRMLEVGSDALIPGFEDELIGMRQGETKTFRIPFPADFYEKELAGKQAQFTVTVNELKEKRLPEMTDEFAKQTGYESIADFRQKAQEYLTRERAQEADRNVRSQLLKELIERNPFDCPESLIQAQTRTLAQDVAQNLKQQNFNDQMVQEALMSELPNLKGRAESQVRASLILETIAKKESLSVQPEEVDSELSNMAKAMKVEEEKLREYYGKNPARRDDLEFRMREDRTVKFLLEHAKVKKEK